MPAWTVQTETMRWLQAQFWKKECMGQHFNSNKSQTIYPSIKTLHTKGQKQVFMIGCHLNLYTEVLSSSIHEFFDNIWEIFMGQAWQQYMSLLPTVSHMTFLPTGQAGHTGQPCAQAEEESTLGPAKQSLRFEFVSEETVPDIEQ